jgi:uncharacterized membrane protein
MGLGGQPLGSTMILCSFSGEAAILDCKMVKNRSRIERFLPWLLIIGGAIGLIAAFIISYDKQKLLQNPSFQPNCDLNPIISCGSVMKSAQGSAFGFPNPWIGLAAFAVLITIGVSILAGARYKRWFWLGLEAGTIFGIGFVHWLFFQSVYRIHALCPYCMAVWVVTITTFWYVTQYNLQQGHIKFPKNKLGQGIQRFIQVHHLDILVLWILIILALILHHFWYYFGKHLF